MFSSKKPGYNRAFFSLMLDESLHGEFLLNRLKRAVPIWWKDQTQQ